MCLVFDIDDLYRRCKILLPTSQMIAVDAKYPIENDLSAFYLSSLYATQQRFLDPATPPFKSSAVSTSMSAPTSSSTSSPVSGQSETGLASETQPTPAPRPLLEARPLMAVEIPCVVSSTASSSSLQHQQQPSMPHPPPLMPEIVAPSLPAASSAAVSAASSNVDVSSTAKSVKELQHNDASPSTSSATMAITSTTSSDCNSTTNETPVPETIQETLLSALESAGNKLTMESDTSEMERKEA